MSNGIYQWFGDLPEWARKLAWPALALLVLLVYDVLFVPGFVPHVKDGRLYGGLVDVVNRGAPVMLLALGMTLVIATAGVDLSVGAIMALGGSAAAVLITRQKFIIGNWEIDTGVVIAQFGVAGVVIVALALCLAAGAWNGVLVACFRIQPIVATLILMVAGRGIAQLLTDGQIITFHNEAFSFIGIGYFLGLPFTVFIVALMFAVAVLLTRATALGLFIESVGGNETASRFSGISPSVVKLFAYAFCGLCAGVAGLIACSNIKAADANNAGLYLELDAIMAVVIGGTLLTGGRFYLAGSLVGALIIQTLHTTVLSRDVPIQYTLVVKAPVVLVVCLLQSAEFRRLIFALWLKVWKFLSRDVTDFLPGREKRLS